MVSVTGHHARVKARGKSTIQEDKMENRSAEVCEKCEKCEINPTDIAYWCSLDDYDVQIECSDDRGMMDGVFARGEVSNDCPFALEHIVMAQDF